MSFLDEARLDIDRIFMQQFATIHAWNDLEITCVEDNSIAERARGNKTDVSYDPNVREIGLFVAEDQFERLPQMQETIFYDRQSMTVTSINTDDGMLKIVLRANLARRVSG
jgi:hypothetical protein